jgi:hypothetical protein
MVTMVNCLIEAAPRIEGDVARHDGRTSGLATFLESRCRELGALAAPSSRPRCDFERR